MPVTDPPRPVSNCRSISIQHSLSTTQSVNDSTLPTPTPYNATTQAKNRYQVDPLRCKKAPSSYPLAEVVEKHDVNGVRQAAFRLDGLAAPYYQCDEAVDQYGFLLSTSVARSKQSTKQSCHRYDKGVDLRRGPMSLNSLKWPPSFSKDDPNFYHVWGNAYFNAFTKTNGETYLYHQLNNQSFVGQAATNGSFQVFVTNTPATRLTEQATYKEQILSEHGCTCILATSNGEQVILEYSPSQTDPAKIQCTIDNRTEHEILLPVYLYTLNGAQTPTSYMLSTIETSLNVTHQLHKISDRAFIETYVSTDPAKSPPLNIYLTIHNGRGVIKEKKELEFEPGTTMAGVGDTVFVSVPSHDSTTISFGNNFPVQEGIPQDDYFVPSMRVTKQPRKGPKQLTDIQWRTLGKEAKWKIAQAASWTQYRTATKRFAIPQGSAYEYNLALGSTTEIGWLPNTGDTLRNLGTVGTLSIIAPDLAKQTLENTMRLQGGIDSLGQDHYGNIPYAWWGNDIKVLGLTPDVRSDIDLEFLHSLYLFLQESLNDATAIEEWLFSEDIPYRHQSNPSSVNLPYPQKPFGHIWVALKHLIDEVGLGQQDLLLVRNGDWSDCLVSSTPGVPQKNLSETVTESLHYCYLAPRLVRLLKQVASDFTSDHREQVQLLTDKISAFYNIVKQGVERSTWNSEKGYFYRAFLYGESASGQLELNVMGNEFMDLNGQLWALLLDPGELSPNGAPNEWMSTLLDKVSTTLDRPFPLGPHIIAEQRPTGLSPLGSDMETNTWLRPASILAMAYMKAGRMNDFWNIMWRTSFSNHAQLFPDQRCGSVSGPDALSNNGLAWSSCFTPMSLFPWANLNSNTGWLWPYLTYCRDQSAIDSAHELSAKHHAKHKTANKQATIEGAVLHNLRILENLERHPGAKLRLDKHGDLSIQRKGIFSQSIPRTFDTSSSITNRANFFQPIYHTFHTSKNTIDQATLQRAFDGLMTMRKTYAHSKRKTRHLNELIDAIVSDNPLLNIPH